MKKFALIAASLCLATAAFAADDMMAGFYGNTLVITDQSGVQKWHYTPDHKLTAVMQDGKKVGGTWSVKDGKLCELPDGQAEACYQMGAKKAGDKWTGRPGMTLEVVAGNQ